MVITIYYKVKQFARFDAFISGGFQGKYSSIVLKNEEAWQMGLSTPFWLDFVPPNTENLVK